MRRTYKNAAKGKTPSGTYDEVRVYMPKGTARLVEEYSLKLSKAKSRLIAIALENELCRETPFEYPLEMPEQVYVDGAFVQEASRMLHYIKRFNTDITLETIILSRRDFGVSDKNTALMAYRELLNNGLVEEITVMDRRFGKQNIYIRLKKEDYDPRAKYKPVETVKETHEPAGTSILDDSDEDESGRLS